MHSPLSFFLWWVLSSLLIWFPGYFVFLLKSSRILRAAADAITSASLLSFLNSLALLLECSTIEPASSLWTVLGIFLGSLFSFLLPEIEGSHVDHDLLRLPFVRRLPAGVLACIAVSLKMCCTALKTPIARIWWPSSFASRERDDRPNIHGIRVFTQTRVTRFEITNSQTKFRLHVRHDFHTRIFKSSQAIGVENQVLLKLLPAPTLPGQPALGWPAVEPQVRLQVTAGWTPRAGAQAASKTTQSPAEMPSERQRILVGSTLKNPTIKLGCPLATRSVFMNSWSNLSSKSKFLLKLRHNLLHRRHRSSSGWGSTGAPPAGRHTASTIPAITVQQTSPSTKLVRSWTLPASFHHATTNPSSDPRNSALPGRRISPRAPTNDTLPALRYHDELIRRCVIR